MRVLFIFLLCWPLVHLAAQPGCTDPQAANYDPAATENDGSCLYPATSYAPVLIANLPNDLDECSGLAWFADRLWTHEDGGNADLLYVLDTLTGAKLQTVTVPNAENMDWEDLAENDQYLFIGDFGNNNGNRTDLRILRLKKADLLAGTALPDTIAFAYSDQTSFPTAPNANNYDCEAFFFWNDSLHLFSKNWLNFKTRHYVLPALPGTYTAELRDSLDVQGLVTGADITDDGKAALMGYNLGSTFLWLLWDFDGGAVFSGNKRKITMGNPLFVSQLEGIVFRNEHYGYLCAERFASQVPQKLFRFDIGQWTNGVSGTLEKGTLPAPAVSPNPFDDYLDVKLPERLVAPMALRLSDAMGRTVLVTTLHPWQPGENCRLELGGMQLPSGLYQLSILGMDGAAGIRLLKK